jgi:hypothetical protein
MSTLIGIAYIQPYGVIIKTVHYRNANIIYKFNDNIEKDNINLSKMCMYTTISVDIVYCIYKRVSSNTNPRYSK